MKNANQDKCYCLEISRKKYGEHVSGKCLKLDCERFRREIEKLKNDIKN